MRILFAEDQEGMRRNVERMVQKEVIPKAAETDEENEIPLEEMRLRKKNIFLRL